MQPGTYDMPAEAYHAGPGASKSMLWKLHSRSPFHARFQTRQETSPQRFGSAAHTAVLEPEKFEPAYERGPDDRRGNKWKDAEVAAATAGRILLTSGDYDDAMRLRDALHRNPLVRKLTANALAERSGYWIDPATGELCRCRPDLYNPGMSVIADLKSTTDASPNAWRKRVADYGFHAQEPWYSRGWAAAGGGDVDAFLFITVERDAPYAHAIYELTPSAVAEGEAIMNAALERYAECRKREAELRERYASKSNSPDFEVFMHEAWPAFGDDVLELDLARWDYKLTQREE